MTRSDAEVGLAIFVACRTAADKLKNTLVGPVALPGVGRSTQKGWLENACLQTAENHQT